MKDIEGYVNQQLPRRPIPESSRPVFPSSPFSKDGTISANGWNWLENKLGYNVNREALTFDCPPKISFKKKDVPSGLDICKIGIHIVKIFMR